jgi:CheY-like chemotaxis protein
MVAFALRKGDFEPAQAGDAREAQAAIADRIPDLILLDWMLPGTSGLELARRWRREALTREVPIIMLTARGEENDRVGGLEAGVDDYVVKPFSARELLARMPHSREVALTYATVLNERGTRDAGRRAQEILRPLLAVAADDPVFQQAFARASEMAGDPVRAGEAYAEAAYLNGRPEQALVQLDTLRKRDDVDYYARSRIDARIAAITPVVLELRREGIRDEDLGRR